MQQQSMKYAKKGGGKDDRKEGKNYATREEK